MTQRKQVVVKRNEVVNASYDLSQSEQRLLLAMIASLDSTEPVSAEEVYEISASEVAKGLQGEVDLKHVYAFMEQAVSRLFERKITVRRPDGTREQFRWIGYAKYQPGEGKVSMQFAQKILKYLGQIRENFTRYNLAEVSAFQSTYSLRFYEWFAQWRDKGQVVIEIDEIRERLALGSKYSNVYELRRRVIDLAVKEISEKSDLQVKVKYLKKGKRIISAQFMFTTKGRAIKQTRKLREAVSHPSFRSVREVLAEKGM